MSGMAATRAKALEVTSQTAAILIKVVPKVLLTIAAGTDAALAVNVLSSFSILRACGGLCDPEKDGHQWIWCGMGDDGQNYAVKPVVAEKPAEPDMGGGGAGGGGAAEPMKYDCKIIGPNEGAGGGSNDPKVTFKCEDIGDGKKECCFYKEP